MAPIIEQIYDYFHKSSPEIKWKSEQADNIQVEPNENLFNLSTTSSHVPFTEVMEKIDNHNGIQENIMNQTVSN